MDTLPKPVQKELHRLAFLLAILLSGLDSEQRMNAESGFVALLIELLNQIEGDNGTLLN